MATGRSIVVTDAFRFFVAYFAYFSNKGKDGRSVFFFGDRNLSNV